MSESKLTIPLPANFLPVKFMVKPSSREVMWKQSPKLMQWLNYIDVDWLASELSNINQWFAIDNHCRISGQGNRIAGAILVAGLQQSKLKNTALDQIPVCATNYEILQSHRFDASQIVKAIITSVGKSS